MKSICPQVKFLISASRIPALSASVQREIDVRGASLAGLLQHPVLFRWRVGFSDCLANLQLEHLSFAEPDAEQVARIAQDAQQKTDFFVDTLRRSAFIEAGILVLNDRRLIEIDQHLAAKNSLQVIDGILGKAR